MTVVGARRSPHKLQFNGCLHSVEGAAVLLGPENQPDEARCVSHRGTRVEAMMPREEREDGGALGVMRTLDR